MQPSTHVGSSQCVFLGKHPHKSVHRNDVLHRRGIPGVKILGHGEEQRSDHRMGERRGEHLRGHTRDEEQRGVGQHEHRGVNRVPRSPGSVV